MAPPPQNDDITRINAPLNFRHTDTLITTKVPQYPPKLTTGMSIIPGWNRPNANGQNANIVDKDYNGPDFKARPLKHWRKQLRVNDYNGPANNSRAASIADLDRPGTTVYHFTPDCTCVAEEGGNSYIISNNKFGYETKDDDYSKGDLDVKIQNNGYITVPYDATEEEVNDPANPAYKVLTGVYNTDCINCSPQGNLIKSGIALQSQAFYSSSNDKLESRCQTYEQNISTNKATGCNYFDAQGIPLWPNDTPNGPQVVAPVNYGSIIYKGNFFNLYEYGYNGIGVGAASEVNSASFTPKIKCNPNYAVAGFYVNISPTTLLEATIYDSTNLVICKSTNTQYSYLNTNAPTPPSFSVAARIFYFPKNIFLEPSKSYYVNFKTINSVIFDWLVYNDSSSLTLSGVLVAEPIYCPSQTIYKPNNIAFGRQGAVSGSTRLKKLVSDTMTMNGCSFYSAKGAQEANLGKYQGTNLSSNYYLKTSPVIDSCRGTPPEPPILLFNNNDVDSITFSWKERGNNVCGVEYYTVTYYAVNIIERIRDVDNVRSAGDIIDEEGMQDFFDVNSSSNNNNNSSSNINININEINEIIPYNSQNAFTKNGVVNNSTIYTDNENNIRFNIISEIKTTNVESIPDPLTAENIAKISSLTPGTYYLMNMISANGNGTSIRSNTVLSNTLFDSEIEIDIKEVNYDYDDAKIKYNYNFTKPVILNVTLTSLHENQPIILTVENAKTFDDESAENIAHVDKIGGPGENTYQVTLKNAGTFNLKATQEKGLSYTYGNSVATSPKVIIAKDTPQFSTPWDIFKNPPVIGKTYDLISPEFDNLLELPEGMFISYEVIIINDLGEESSDSDNIITITPGNDKTKITINKDGKFKIKAITNETQNYNPNFIISKKEYCIEYDTPEIEFTGEIVETEFIYSKPKSFDINVKFIHPEQQPQNMFINYSIDTATSTNIVTISDTTVKILGSGTFRIKANIPKVGIYKENTFFSNTITIDKFTPIPDENWDSIKETSLIVGKTYDIAQPTFKNLIPIPAEILPITYTIIDASGNPNNTIAELRNNNTKIEIKTKGLFKIKAETKGSDNYYQATVTSDNEYPTLENQIQIEFPKDFVNKITYGDYYAFKTAYIINPLPKPAGIVITYSIQNPNPPNVASIIVTEKGTDVKINTAGTFKIKAETNEITGQYLKAESIISPEVKVDKDRPKIEIGLDGDIFNFAAVVGKPYDFKGASISYPHPNPAEILPITYTIIDALGNPNNTIATLVNNNTQIKINEKGLFKIKAETKGSDNYYVADVISKTEYTTTEGQPIISFGDIKLGPFTYGTKDSFIIPAVIFIHPDPKPSSMEIKYESTDDTVAIVNVSNFTITGAGQFTIRATTIDSTNNYKTAIAEIDVTVKKADIKFNVPWVVYENALITGKTYTINPPKFLDRDSLPTSIPDFIYESSNTLIADISGNVVQVKASGEFTIDAKIPMNETSNYNTSYIKSEPIYCTLEGKSVISFPENFIKGITYGETYTFNEAYFKYPSLDTQIDGTATLSVSGSTLTVSQTQFNLFIIGATLEVDTDTVENISLSVDNKLFTNDLYIISISFIHTNDQILNNVTSIKNIKQIAKSPAGFSINYESTNNNVATISKGTGTWVVTIIKPGSFRIKATTETTGTVAYEKSDDIFSESVTVEKADLSIEFVDDIFPGVNILLVGTPYDFTPATKNFPPNVIEEEITIYYECDPTDIGTIVGTKFTVITPSKGFRIKAFTKETDYFNKGEVPSKIEKSTRYDKPVFDFNNFKEEYTYDNFSTDQEGLNTYILEDIVFYHPDQTTNNISSLGLSDVIYKIHETNDGAVAKLSNKKIYTIDGIEKTVNIIKVYKAGKFTVTAETLPTTIYEGNLIHRNVTIFHATPTFNDWVLYNESLFAGNNYFFERPTFKTPSPPPNEIMNFTYQSNNNDIADIADVNNLKRLIIKTSGEFTITAISPPTDKYKSQRVTSTKRSTKLQEPIIIFNPDFVTNITYGETYRFVGAYFEYPKSSSNLSIEYESNNPEVATISAETAAWVVKINKVGSFQIIATTIETVTSFYKTEKLSSETITVTPAKPGIKFGGDNNDIFPNDGALLVNNPYNFTPAIITLPSSVNSETINITYESSDTFVANIPDAKIAKVKVNNPGKFIITAKTSATNNFTEVSIPSSENLAYSSNKAGISFPISYETTVTYGDTYTLPGAVFYNPMPTYVPSTLTIKYSIEPERLEDDGVASISGNNVILNKSGKFKIKAQAINTPTTPPTNPKIADSDPIYTKIITVEKYQPVFKDGWDAISNSYEPLYVGKTIPITPPDIVIPNHIPNILSEILPFTYTYYYTDTYGEIIIINSVKVGNVDPPSITIKGVGSFKITATTKGTNRYNLAPKQSLSEKSTYLSKPIIIFDLSFNETIVLPRDASYILSTKNQQATFTYPQDGRDTLNNVFIAINYKSTNSDVADISGNNVTVKKVGSFKIIATTTTTNLFTAIEEQQSRDIKVEQNVSNTKVPSIPSNIISLLPSSVVFGATLKVDEGTWIGTPAPTFTYKWYSDNALITSPPSNTYTTTVSDIGKPIYCKVTGSNIHGSVEKTSNSISVCTFPKNDNMPAISGTTMRSGDKLTVSNGTWSGTPNNFSFTYQWNIKGTTSSTSILGATGNDYTPNDSDIGKNITCDVTANNKTGTVATATSSNTIQVLKPVIFQDIDSQGAKTIITFNGPSPIDTSPTFIRANPRGTAMEWFAVVDDRSKDAIKNHAKGIISSSSSSSSLSRNALNFNGVNDYVNLGIPDWTYSTQFRTTMTIECWFKTTDANSQKGNASFVTRWYSGGYDAQFMFGMNTSGNVYFYAEGVGGLQSPLEYKDTRWHHVAATFNSVNSELILYIDGSSVNTTSSAGTSKLLTDNRTLRLLIGSDDRGLPDRQFRGSIADVRIWNVVRSASDIQNNYLTQLFGNEPGLVFYAKLNQGTANSDNNGVIILQDNLALPSVTTIKTPIVTGIATQSNSVGTGASSNGIYYASWCSNVPNSVCFAEYRLVFSNGVVSDMTIQSNSPQGLTNPSLLFAIKDVPIGGVKAILQGKNISFVSTDNKWYDVDVPVQQVNDNQTSILFTNTTGNFKTTTSVPVGVLFNFALSGNTSNWVSGPPLPVLQLDPSNNPIPIKNIVTTLMTDMSSMFEGASAFNQDIRSWDTSKVTNMSSMFKGATAFNQNIGNWLTVNVTNMSSMFKGASAFNQFIGNWKTSNVINMSSMFEGASAFNQDISSNKDISSWDTSNVTDMSAMFSGATAFNGNIGNWNTGSVANMSAMFKGATVFNINIGGWNMRIVTNMSSMFSGATAFNQIIGSWNTRNVTDMSSMFQGANAFNQNINWNTQNVTNMSSMFKGAAAFNQNIGSWRTENVTDMSSMFQNATAFNQDIKYYIYNSLYSLSYWNTQNVTNMSSMFQGAAAFNQNIGNWITSSVTNMSSMFQGAAAFNQDISKWNTSLVTNMSSMFNSAANFNQYIASWDTSRVTTMQSMFSNAYSFNQPLQQRHKKLIIRTGGSDWQQRIINNDTTNANILGWGYDEQWYNPKAASYNEIALQFRFYAAYVTKLYNISSGSATVFVYGGIMGTYYFTRNGLDNYTGRFYYEDIRNWAYTLPISISSGIIVPKLIDNWDTSNVTDMSSMFQNAFSFNNTISSWNTSNVTNMSDMFNEARVFNNNISSWNTQNVTTMRRMFATAYDFNQPILSYWKTSKVTNMAGMFSYAYAFNNAGVTNAIAGSWDTGNVTDMSYMFEECRNFNIPIGNWNTSKVTNMYSMFNGATSFNNGLTPVKEHWGFLSSYDVSVYFIHPQQKLNWDVLNVTNMNYMFWGAKSFFNVYIRNWSVTGYLSFQGFRGNGCPITDEFTPFLIVSRGGGR